MAAPIVSPLLAEVPWIEHGFGVRGSEEWPPFPERAIVKQVHGIGCVEADHPGEFGEADALFTRADGPYLSIRTADCLPVLVVDLEQRTVAAIHAGWRGVVGRIVPRMLDRMDAGSGNLRIAIGPGIGKCCFEVGPEVAQQFGRLGRQCVDLKQEILGQLAVYGVAERHIWTAGLCTVCNITLHSHRREKEKAGRMVSAIRIRPFANLR
jgi:YfiH family protein